MTLAILDGSSPQECFHISEDLTLYSNEQLEYKVL